MTEIKVCGIKKEDDLLRLIDLNVTWAGFVFYKDSIRNVDYNHDSLFEIARNKIGIVCLFVNPRNEFISKIVQKVKPDLIQLHGSETPERCNEIKKMFGIPIMKAIEVKNSESLKQVYKYEEIVDRFLFDSKLTKQKLQGNKTDTINWDILKKYSGNKKWMLAGGLNHRNILEAIKKSNSKNVDVSSGVESSPGVKSKELLNKFIHKIRSLKS
ncbi:MAG: N-(5'-phosphoribosyl)anthranilate isomerase [Alphaproteobacteria bacterium]|nr:MAG: N-(5'-phosphoribosyl)anthranilate isomerase [Alphaproteobacteria bacterium]